MEWISRKRHKKMENISMESHNKMMTELPLSLIESHILPRLPAKSVGRCMCVCKQWNSFLSTPTFAGMHLRHVTINDYKVLLLLDRNPDPSSIRILASLDGLVCLASKDRLAFWNPLTGAYKKLAFPLYLDNDVDAIGFYRDSSNDYKLLFLDVDGAFTHIYSHRLDSWREIECSISARYQLKWSPATFLGQSLYFCVTELSIRSHTWIVCFDVNTETFRKIRFPPIPDGVIACDGSLVVLNGCIHLCVSYKNTDIDVWSNQGDLWRMEGDDGWAKVAAFSDPIYNDFGRQHICTATTGNWLAVLEENNDSFRRMNTEDFTRHYWYFSPPSVAYRSRRMIYVETLVSPNL